MTTDHVDDVAGGTVDSAKSSRSPDCLHAGQNLGKCGVIMITFLMPSDDYLTMSAHKLR